jgi:internalin A
MDFDPKAPGELLKNFGASDAHSKKFSETFLGSLLGQSRAFAVALAVYAAVVIAILKYFGYAPKELLEHYGPFALALAFGAPLLCIFLFSFIPAYIQARRESRQKQKAIAGELRFQPGYFRLTPYEVTDREKFSRLDGADETIFNWLMNTEQSLLYLSGASGVGKSSLLAANIEPRLWAQGWTIIATRLFGDPIERVLAALLESEDLFAEQPDSAIGLRDILALAAQSRKAPLLLIVDQFEEFLILNKPEDRAPFAAFLQELAGKPIEGLRLLLVYRSDYRALIFKLALPSPILGKNWVEIAPYNRGEATLFLQSGGRRLSDKALSALFDGLDRAEEARGVYRLITLNMVGLILERMGQNLDEDPERLIQSYLMSCLTSSEGSEYARPVLEHMITEAGTKEPKTEVALTEVSGMEPWQVKSALRGMETQGLVRRLEGSEPTWEISHDFIARALGRLIGRLKPSIFLRVQPYITPAVLMLWIAFLAFVVPDQLTRANELHVMNYATLRNNGGVYEVRPLNSGFDDERLLLVAPFLMRLPGELILDLSNTRVSNIDALKDLKSLTSLDLSNTLVISIDALKELSRITSLYLSNTKISNVEALKDLKSITALYLRNTQVSNIDALKESRGLTSLDLTGTRVANINALKDLKSLKTLGLSNTPFSEVDTLTHFTNLSALGLSNTPACNVDALKSFKALRVLDLSNTGVSNISWLKDLEGLTALDLSSTRVTNVEVLRDLHSLNDLDLSDTRVSNVEALKGLNRLSRLDLSNTPVTNVDALKDLKGLSSLNLSGTDVEDVDALKELESLTSLDLSRTRVSSVAALKDLKSLKNLELKYTVVVDFDALRRPTLRINLNQTNDFPPCESLSPQTPVSPH